MSSSTSFSNLDHASVVMPKTPRIAEGNEQGQLSDIREMSYAERQALLQGPPLHIFIEGEIVTTTPLLLIRHTSTKADDLISNNEIHLPNGTDRAGVTRLIHHLHWIIYNPQWPAPRMAATQLPFLDLSVCVAGRLLGLDLYTNHVYNFYVAHMANDIPLYVEITAVQRFEVEHVHLNRIMTRQLAYLVRNKLIPDPEDFDAYLVQHPRLAQGISKVNATHERRQNSKKEEREAREANAKEVQARREADEKAWHQNEVTRRKEKKARWDMKEKCDRELSKTVREKLHAKKPFTAEEKRHYVSLYGKQVPKGL